VKSFRPILIAATLLVALAGCSVHANLTVPASEVATQAAKLLQKQVKSKTAPGIDCGKGQVDLVVATKVDCTLTDPVDASKYDTVITVTKVKGTDYSIHVKVADSAKGDSAVPTVPAAQIDQLAADAIEQSSGARPTIDCGSQKLPIVQGNVFDCTATSTVTGDIYTATITVTTVNGDDFHIDTQIGDAPIN
jgi:predicted small lipoprotein YifL